jgi:hypothetical protein
VNILLLARPTDPFHHPAVISLFALSPILHGCCFNQPIYPASQPASHSAIITGFSLEYSTTDDGRTSLLSAPLNLLPTDDGH